MYDLNKADNIFSKLPIEAQSLIKSGSYVLLQKNMKQFIVVSSRGIIFEVDPASGELEVNNNIKTSEFLPCFTSLPQVSFGTLG